MAAGTHLRALERNVSETISNEREILRLVESFHELVTDARRGLETPERIEDRAESLERAAETLGTALALLSRLPYVGGLFSAFSQAVKFMGRGIGEVEESAEALRIRIERTGIPDRLREMEEDLTLLEADIAEKIAKHVEVQEATQTAIDVFDRLGRPVQPLSDGVDVTAGLLNGVIVPVNDTYAAIRDAVRDAIASVDIGVLRPVEVTSRTVERVADAVSSVTDPIETAFSKIEPVKWALKAAGFIFDRVVQPIIDFLIDKLGIDDLIDAALRPLLESLGLDALAALQREFDGIFEGLDQFSGPDGFGAEIEDWLADLERDVFQRLSDATLGATGFGTAGDDVLQGDAGHDFLAGFGGNDLVRGGAGDDIVLAGPGDDRIEGGAGFDRLVLTGTISEYTWTLLAAEGEVTFVHTAPLRGRTADAAETAVSVEEFVFLDAVLTFQTLRDNTRTATSGTLIGTRDTDLLFAGTFAPVRIEGLGGADRITGSPGADTLLGGPGDDVIDARAGADFVNGGSGSDTWLVTEDGNPSNARVEADLVAGTGFFNGTTDTLVSIENLVVQDDRRDAFLFGDDGANRLAGGGGEDLLVGRGGSDLLQGGGRNDVLIGGRGADTVEGGDGSDILIAGGPTRDADRYEGGAGSDTLTYSTDLGLLNLPSGMRPSDLPQLESSGRLSVDTGTGRIRRFDASGNRLLAVDQASGIETFIGSDAADRMVGAIGPDGEGTGIGGAGGDDVLISAGARFVSGDAGNDLLVARLGGQQDNTDFEGGSGFDTLDLRDASSLRWTVWENTGGRASLQGFRSERTGGLADPLVSGGDAHLVLRGNLEGIERLLLGEEADRVELGSEFRTEVRGGGGDDVLARNGGSGDQTVLDGEAGNDTIGLNSPGSALGGAGDDRITVFSPGSGGTVDGGAGNDVVRVGRFQGTLEGGAGFDRLAVLSGRAVTTIDLANGTIGSSDLNGIGASTLRGFEQVSGSTVLRDVMFGAAIDERLLGRGGDDWLAGGGGDDELYGGTGADLLQGGGGDDLIHGGPGRDRLEGGPGIDTVSYANTVPDGDEGQPAGQPGFGASVDLAVGTGTVAGEPDQLTGFENAIGSASGDFLRGDEQANLLDGGRGDDVLEGRDGNDVLLALEGNDRVDGGAGDDRILVGPGTHDIEGGPGRDRLEFGEDLVSWRADFLAETLTATFQVDRAIWADGGGTEIRLFRGQSLTPDLVRQAGASFVDSADDLLRVLPDPGSTDASRLAITTATEQVEFVSRMRGIEIVAGGAGDDLLAGGAGRDVLDGGAGANRISFAADPGPVLVRMAQSLFRDGAGNRDEVSRVSGVIGSRFDDILEAGARSATLDGRSGDDRLSGGAGADVLVGGQGNDVLLGNAGNDRLDGGHGNDRIEGGPGEDTAEYRSATTAVAVDLALTRPQATGGAGRDLLRGIEHLLGGAGDDVLSGDGRTNRLDGARGDDTLEGRAGDDWLTGGLGADLLRGGSGADVFRYFSAAESRPGSFDRILDFQGAGATAGDIIHLRRIDADPTTAEDDAFVFGSTRRGGLWVTEIGDQTRILANLDDDAAPELEIRILDGAVRASSYTAADFVL